MHGLRKAAWMLGWAVVWLTACRPLSTPTPSALPTAGVADSPTAPMRPSATASFTPTQRPGNATDVPLPTASPTRTPTATATPCPPIWCAYPVPFWLERPIQPPGRDRVDPTYRFGSTVGGQREVHHGVEFVNSRGTPVHAVAAGEVVFAGADDRQSVGPGPNFYGRVVVLRHDLPGLEAPLFTLYGHLSRVDVEVGQQVPAGAVIGAVGASGVAVGSHLHFEVRYGANEYAAVQNPELWLRPHEETGGVLAGRFPQDGYRPDTVVVEALTGPQGARWAVFYLEPYGDPALTAAAVWGEQFALGDLPAGWYRVKYVLGGRMWSFDLQVFPNQITILQP